MEKIQLSVTDFKNLARIHADKNMVFQMPDGDILKIFSPTYLQIFFNSTNGTIEDKILDAKEIPGVPQILVPRKAVYLGGNFAGYTMENAQGESFLSYTQNLTVSEQEDLLEFAKMYMAIENPVRKASNVVFPDLCTCDNIFIQPNQNEYNIQFIDYDGLQVDEHKSSSISNALGDMNRIRDKKYLNSNLFFTKELDKKSLIHLYFLSTFHVDLTKVDQYHPEIQKTTTLDDLFSFLQLDDWDVMDKVYKVLKGKGENEYLGEDVFRIADTYRMHAYPVPGKPNSYIKVLEKK